MKRIFIYFHKNLCDIMRAAFKKAALKSSDFLGQFKW